MFRRHSTACMDAGTQTANRLTGSCSCTPGKGSRMSPIRPVALCLLDQGENDEDSGHQHRMPGEQPSSLRAILRVTVGLRQATPHSGFSSRSVSGKGGAPGGAVRAARQASHDPLGPRPGCPRHSSVAFATCRARRAEVPSHHRGVAFRQSGSSASRSAHVGHSGNEL
jgi:hypothetical protein